MAVALEKADPSERTSQSILAPPASLPGPERSLAGSDLPAPWNRSGVGMGAVQAIVQTTSALTRPRVRHDMVPVLNHSPKPRAGEAVRLRQ